MPRFHQSGENFQRPPQVIARPRRADIDSDGIRNALTAELMTKGQLIASETFRALEVYLVIAAIYFAVCYPLSQCLLWLERSIRAGVPLTLGRRRRLKLAKDLLAKGAMAT